MYFSNDCRELPETKVSETLNENCSYSVAVASLAKVKASAGVFAVHFSSTSPVFGTIT